MHEPEGELHGPGRGEGGNSSSPLERRRSRSDKSNFRNAGGGLGGREPPGKAERLNSRPSHPPPLAAPPVALVALRNPALRAPR